MLNITIYSKTQEVQKKVHDLCEKQFAIYPHNIQNITKITGDVCFVEYALLEDVPDKTLCIVIGKDTKEDIYQSTTKHIFGYIREPYFEDDFNQIAKELVKEVEIHFLEYKIQTKNLFASIRVHSIYYIESYRHTLTIFSQIGTFEERKTLQQFIIDCKSKNLLQIHKSYIINILQCKAIVGNSIELLNGVLLPIGKTYKEKVKNMLEKD